MPKKVVHNLYFVNGQVVQDPDKSSAHKVDTVCWVEPDIGTARVAFSIDGFMRFKDENKVPITPEPVATHRLFNGSLVSSNGQPIEATFKRDAPAGTYSYTVSALGDNPTDPELEIEP